MGLPTGLHVLMYPEALLEKNPSAHGTHRPPTSSNPSSHAQLGMPPVLHMLVE
jgi:hypothetical protein